LHGWQTETASMFHEVAGPSMAPTVLGYSAYFGVLFLLAGWPWMTARDRSRRVRVWSVARTTALAGLLGVLWPSPQPWGLTAMAVTAIVVQATMPWSEPAARYARYAARLAKQNRGRRVA
jgi:hypothetical protein